MKSLIIWVFVAIVVFVVLITVTDRASAKTFVCDQTMCKGTKHRDVITGTSLSQTIYGLGKGDRIVDTANQDNDSIYGGRGNDTIDVRDSNGKHDADYVNCGPGTDVAYVDKNDTTINCETVVV